MEKRVTEVLSRKLHYENRVWKIYLDHVRNGDAEVPEYVCMEPKGNTAAGFGGVSVVPCLDGKIGLIKNYRHPVKSYSLEGARGFIDAGETPELAAHRELGEEAGVTCGRLRALGDVFPDAGTIASRIALFYAEDCTVVGRVAATDVEPGLGDVEWFSRDDVRAMIARYEIKDVSTLIILMHVLG